MQNKETELASAKKMSSITYTISTYVRVRLDLNNDVELELEEIVLLIGREKWKGKYLLQMHRDSIKQREMHKMETMNNAT